MGGREHNDRYCTTILQFCIILPGSAVALSPYYPR